MDGVVFVFIGVKKNMASLENKYSEVADKRLQVFMDKHTFVLEEDLKPLYQRIGDARIVLLGEASHGTHEYYTWRSRITRHLIEKKGFNLIGVEGDWPDCYKINRFIRHYENSRENALDVLKEFHRWPQWMWSNWEMIALTEWLKEHNKGRTSNHQAGFYGLDVYSLWESLDAIRNYLKKNDPDALVAAQDALQCFEPYGREPTQYASHTRFAPETCETEVVELLLRIRENVSHYNTDREGPFNAEQNALTAVNAERYYRAMIGGGARSWNIRDEHMADTIERLLDFHGPQAKIIVWEHNTHIGDARATSMKQGGMFNVGQLVREKWGHEDTVLIGFGSYRGSVIASREWGAPMQKMNVPEARKNSWEQILHQLDAKDRLIITDHIREHPFIKEPLNHRAIGVVYHPDRDYHSNYVPSLMADRYDAFIYLDQTKALHPVLRDAEDSTVPDTYPWGV